MKKLIRFILNGVSMGLMLGLSTSFAQQLLISKYSTSFFLPLVNPISSLVYKLISLPKNLISP